MKKNSPAYDIVIIALMSAMLVGVKFALQIIPYNVEAVTLLIFVFVCGFGFTKTFYACIVFCILDNVLYSFSIDVTASYFTYWPLLTAVIAILNKKPRNEYINCAAAFVMTLLFGVITSFYQAVITGPDFIAIYLFGLPFYAIHVAVNTISVLILFKPLVKLVRGLNKKSY